MKAGELNWTDFYKSKNNDDYKHTPQALWVNDPSIGIAPKGDAKPLLAKGEVPKRPTNEQIAKAILANAPKQPTDEEMFGHLVVSQEQIDKAKEDFDNKITNFFKEAQKQLTGQTEVPDEEWANGTSFNSMLSKEELAKRNMHLGDE